MSDIHIRTERLSFAYDASNGRVETLANIDLEVRRGSFLSIIGPSGCGKTSLLRLIAGLEKPTGGKLEVFKAKDSRLRCGFVFQTPALFPWLTARGNIEKPLKVVSGLSSAKKQSDVQRVLEQVGLEEFADKYPHQLSGGMQQRVSLARALATDPDLLLMDEPFGALDEMTRETMNAELHALWQRTGKTVCFVTHSIPEAVFLSTDIVVLSSRPGRVVGQFKSKLPAKRTPRTLETKAFNDLASRVRKALRFPD